MIKKGDIVGVRAIPRKSKKRNFTGEAKNVLVKYGITVPNML